MSPATDPAATDDPLARLLAAAAAKAGPGPVRDWLLALRDATADADGPTPVHETDVPRSVARARPARVAH